MPDLFYLALFIPAMSSSLRPLALPQCSLCARNYLSAGFGELAAPTTALSQQIRGKKKMANTSSAIPVRLLKNVQTFGRKGEADTFYLHIPW